MVDLGDRENLLAKGAHVELVGRANDLGRIEVLVGSKDCLGGAVLLSGAPGVGKSALLNVLARQASEAGVIKRQLWSPKNIKMFFSPMTITHE